MSAEAEFCGGGAGPPRTEIIITRSKPTCISNIHVSARQESHGPKFLVQPSSCVRNYAGRLGRRDPVTLSRQADD
jgi:hypothetical protein